ncbi:TonB-dependent receptor [Pedobacter sp. L105]|uniref:SusC/RagA family TonB-linked outer membrane protein n=1 Tax=Pedobacter sp. L105 TaxID=1641871 RepID=UPI00131BAA00|nr:TonB-dependent receptor [Pedobacter sp. L105]
MKRIFTKFSVLSFLCLLFFNVASAQNITVKGTVSDGKDNTTLPSVSVTVKGTTTGIQTDINGKYSISVPAAGTLVFTYIGYTTQEIPVNNRTTINVPLASASQQLEQVVVVGYGTQRKIDVTGSVATVKGEDISKQASNNAVSALQGKVAGVSISNAGTPGASPQITIRGTGTIYGNTGVLYVVDGVWYDDISFLNPADIANISILKDASSQSIYGIRAANGVVLVTTVHGKQGDPTINYNGSIGVQHVTNAVKMANATEYATAVNELYSLEGATPLFSNTNLGQGTDWYKQVLRSAMVTNHQVSINGGTEKSSYNFSLGYLNQDGIIEKNNYKRYTARLSNDFQLFKNLKIGYNVTGISSTSADTPPTIFHALFAASPVVPVFNADGSYGDPNTYNLGNGSAVNPQAILDFYHQSTKIYKATGNVYAELKFAKHFTFKTSAGGDFGQTEVRNYTPEYYATTAQNSNISSLSVNRIETRNYILENTLNYDNKWGDHSLTVLAGQTAQRYKTYNLNASAQNVPDGDGNDYLSLGNADSRIVNDSGTINTATSYFGRINYSYKNKYLLNASMRADAASQFFGGSDLWGYFPSVGAGWVISNEDFMKNQNIFSNLKLRGSWGKVGNAGVPINPTTLTVDQTAALIAFYNGIANTGASVTTIVPPALFWERSAGTDIGLEMGFLKNRLNFEADYYSRKTEQAIFDIPILGSLGTSNSSIIGNQADFRNRGFEFVASWSDKTASGLSYTISGNVGTNSNKVLNVISGANPIYAGGEGLTGGGLATRTVEGSPIGEFFGYKVAGIFQTNAEAASSGQSGAKAGDFKYVDENHDGIIDGKDRVELGNPNPKITYGLNTTFNYKNFDLTIDIQGVAGVDIYNANLGDRFGNENFTQKFYDNRWTGAGSTNAYPSTNLAGGMNNAPNSFYVESGAYIRLRNFQLGYTLPEEITKKWKMKKLRVFANAQNALNFFGYRGFSPEVNSIPPAGTSTVSPTSAGIDTNVYPLYATYNIGVNLTF